MSNQNGMSKIQRSDRGRTRGNRHRGAVNVCDRSGRSPVGRTEICRLKEANPNRWKDAGEAEWWRHGRCGQVARKDAAGRSPVHPLAPPASLATGCPFAIGRHMYASTGIHINNTHTNVANLFSSLLNCRLLSVLSLLLLPSRCLPPPFSPSSAVSALDPNASARLN